MSNRSHDDGEQQFEPGPSFTDDAPGAPPLSELPSWLQSFAESVEEPEQAQAGPALASSPDLAATEGGGGNDPSMPDWLSSQRTDPGSAFGNIESTVGPGFFSEDDLPEWLRALNADDGNGESPSLGEVDGGLLEPSPDTGSSRTLTVPLVTNVWVTGMEERVENPGAALFATIASGGASRPDIGVATLPVSGSQATTKDAEAQHAEAQPDSGTKRPGWTRRERILAVLVIIMSIILLVMLNFSAGG
jgi:hypothetical protein